MACTDPISKDALIYQAREQLTELPESVMFSLENLAALIPAAIIRWQEMMVKDKRKRQNFIVKSEQTITGGELDLTNAIDDYGYRVEYIEESDFEIAETADKTFEIKFVSSKNRLRFPGIQDKFFTLAYLSGKLVTFRDPNPPMGENPLTSLNAEVILRSVVVPTDLGDIPSPVLPEIATEIANIARGQFLQQNKGLDMRIKT